MRQQPVVAVRANDEAPTPDGTWPTNIPAVAQVLREGTGSGTGE
ncbi:hypothetical protein AB1285_20030 [Microbacterium sp. NRRL B-14842]